MLNTASDEQLFSDNKISFNVINTNARSLRPKMSSFIECFINLSLVLAVVSETWFAAGGRLEQEAEALLLGHGLRLTSLNRAPLSTGVAYGGVAVIIKESEFKSKTYDFNNNDKFEVLPISLTHINISRPIMVIAAYIPPGYGVPRGRACLQHISDIILDMKNKYQDPLLVVAGDFNHSCYKGG